MLSFAIYFFIRLIAYQVEQQIQIRPIQHFVVKHLLENPEGNVTQLNVGLGKTRVSYRIHFSVFVYILFR